MKHFKETEKHLGRLPQKVKTTLEYEYIGDGIFVKATSSCGCSKPTWDNSTRTLTVEYTPNEVPVHLQEQGEYIASKSIKVIFNYSGKETEHVLKFKSKIFK